MYNCRVSDTDDAAPVKKWGWKQDAWICLLPWLGCCAWWWIHCLAHVTHSVYKKKTLSIWRYILLHLSVFCSREVELEIMPASTVFSRTLYIELLYEGILNHLYYIYIYNCFILFQVCSVPCGWYNETREIPWWSGSTTSSTCLQRCLVDIPFPHICESL